MIKGFKIVTLLTLFLSPFQIFSQNADVEMADSLRSNGKIYVVVVGLVIILTGLIVLLLRIEKKLRQLENQEKSGSK